MNSVKFDANHGYVLVKDGHDSFCPFQSPTAIPTQTSMGGMSMNLMRMPCSTSCPLANYNNKEKTYYISCGSERKLIIIEEKEEDGAKLISI